jgi:hypothetical protein
MKVKMFCSLLKELSILYEEYCPDKLGLFLNSIANELVCLEDEQLENIIIANSNCSKFFISFIFCL